MLRNPWFVVVLSVALASCSVMSKKDEWPDDTPTNSTAVLETHMTSDGIKGFFPFDGTKKTYTRAAMHREDSTLKGTGTITRFIVGSSDTARIDRLDRKLIWTLDAKEKTYTECPLKGCVTPPPAQKPEEKKSEKTEKAHEPECKVKIANSSFTVTPTGQKQNLNGFDTDAYKVAWVATLQDSTARKTVSTLNVDVWTTPMTPALKEAITLEQTYARTLTANMSGSAAANSEKTQIIPSEAQKAIDAYIARMLNSADRASFLSTGKELGKIKGYPIVTQLSWNLQGDACAQKDGESGSSGKSSSSDLLTSVTDFFGKKKADDIASKPIFAFTAEVKSHKIEAVHDSVFSPPKGYTLANPR